MEPQNKRVELKVGLFVAIGLIASAVSVLLLGGDRITFSKRPEYVTRFTEVQGLFPGSVVSLAGLRIGNIKAITLGDDLKLDLVMQIEPQFAGRVTEGAIVEVKTQGALGDKYIYIKPGPADAKPLPSGSVLPADETDFMKLLTDREDGMARAVDLVKELHILVASLNQDGKTSRMMTNMSDASDKLKSTLTKLDAMLGEVNGAKPEDQKLKRALTSLASVLEKIDKGQGSLGQLINDPSLHQSLKTMFGSSNRGKFLKDMARETIQTNDGK